MIIQNQGESPQRLMNEAGQERWELVCVTEEGMRKFYFKRPIVQ